MRRILVAHVFQTLPGETEEHCFWCGDRVWISPGGRLLLADKANPTRPCCENCYGAGRAWLDEPVRVGVVCPGGIVHLGDEEP